MGLAEYLGVLKKHKVLIGVAVVAGLLLAVLLSVLTTPRYQAVSQVFVSTRESESVNDLVAGTTFTSQRVKSYTALVTSPRVLEPVIEDLGLTDTPEELAERVTAESPEETVLISITVTDEAPSTAARTADAIAASLASVVADLEQPSGAAGSPVEISAVRNAVPPESPVTPRPMLNIALGLLGGLIVGVGLAVLREALDTRIRTQSDVEELTGASVVGAIAFDEDAGQQPLIVQGSPHSRRAEAFRRLRTNLQFLEVDGDGGRNFVVTSSLPGEGKSTASINLAIALADAGTRVLLVDGDLRRPSVSKYLNLEGAVGLTTVLIGRASLADAVQQWGNPNLHVLPSGQIPPNPSELLGSAQMAKLLTQLEEEYDVAVIDSAPLIPVTDGAILAKLTGGAILVVGAGMVHKAQVQEALRALETVGARVLGVVVNRLMEPESTSYHYRYYEGDGEHRVQEMTPSGQAGDREVSEIGNRS